MASARRLPRPDAGTTGRLFILAALSAFGPLSIDLYLPALPRLTADFGAPASLGQLTLTACLVGLAVGQLVAGPVSDRSGRRPPLLVALGGYGFASLLCAVAPSIWILVGLRFVQGLCGAAGIVVARAIVRDVATGAAAARFFSLLMLVVGIVPVAAPIAGGLLLRVTDWRGLFVVLSVVDGTILLATAFGLRETNPLARRVSSSERTTYRDLVQDRKFAAWVVMIGLTFAAMFSYIAGSSFVLEDIYGVSPLVYGLAFGVNACGIVAFSMANRRLLRTRSPRQLLLLGVVVAAVGGVALVAAVLAGKVGLAGLLPCLFVAVAPIGLVLPNAAALALAPYPHAAGRASALIGLLQFGCGAVVAPVVGIAGKQTAIPMALLVCGCTTAALAVAVRSAAGGKRRSAIPLQEAA